MLKLIYLLLSIATAAPITTGPGRAVVIAPCTPDAADACWERAQALERFVAPSGVIESTVQADIRLAHQDGMLLINAQKLPEGYGVQIDVSKTEEEHLGTATGEIVGAGISTLPMETQVKAGTLVSLRVGLVTLRPDGMANNRLPWTPTGPADAVRAFQGLFTSAPAVGLGINVNRKSERLVVLAPGATTLELKEERLVSPSRKQGAPKPWMASGDDQIRTRFPPRSGWFTVTAVWHNPAGQAIDISARRFHWRADPAPGASALDIHPAPTWHATHTDGPFRISHRTRIAVNNPEWLPAAQLLAEEVERFTGHTPEVVESKGRTGDIRIQKWKPSHRFKHLPSMKDALADVKLNKDAFGIQVNKNGATILASHITGAVYGAVAFADSVGWDATAPGFEAVDRPELPERILYHRLNLNGQLKLDVEDYERFIRTVLTRGRYNTLVLNFSDSMALEKHPELSNRNAVSSEDLQTILETAHELGIDVVPGISVPSHAAWLVNSYPRLGDDAKSTMVCVRHPDLYPLLTTLYEEILEAFGDVDRFHIGHDELIWRSEGLFGDERNPRCYGTPRWRLLAESLEWHAKFFAERDIRPMLWSDMLVEGFNGHREGTHRALENFDPDLLKRFIFVSWSPIGDTVGEFGPQGFEVHRAHTGYLDGKRVKLDVESTYLRGEGLAIFLPAPWSTFGQAPGTRPLHYHWPSVILAGTTGWRHDLAETSIEATLLPLTGAPGFTPGYNRVPDWNGRSKPILMEGSGPTATLPKAAWPESATVSGLTFGKIQPKMAAEGWAVDLPIGSRAAGISLLQAAVVSWPAYRALQRGQKKDLKAGSPPIARMTVTYTDGEEVTHDIRLGVDTERLDGDPRAISLWNTAGTLKLPSPQANRLDPDVQDRHLFRLDWENPRPKSRILRARIETLEEGVWLIVAGAEALDAP